MARIRTIKPEFFTSHDIVVLTPLSRLFYVALWCESDREGRLSWKPKTLKLRYFPADDCDIMVLANELIDHKLIIIYEVDNHTYAEIPSFKNHQVINNREAESNIPSRVKEACARVQGEGKEGREGKAREARKKPIPKDFSISDNIRKWAQDNNHTNLEKHLEHFINVCLAKGYTNIDWDAAFRNAIKDNWAKLEITKPRGLVF